MTYTIMLGGEKQQPLNVMEQNNCNTLKKKVTAFCNILLPVTCLKSILEYLKKNCLH